MSVTELEQPLVDEQADGEHQEQPARDGGLFDADRYKDPALAIPNVDGESIDRIKLSFTGSIFLDRSAPADVALYNKLRFGKEVTLAVEGRCNDTGAKGATDREGNLDVVVGRKSIKITTVYLSTIDGLVAAGTIATDEEEDDQ